MGAHSLGGASRANSGYQGKWTGPQNPGFNELFFKNMIDPAITWTNVVSNSGPGRKDERNEYCPEALG